MVISRHVVSAYASQALLGAVKDSEEANLACQKLLTPFRILHLSTSNLLDTPAISPALVLPCLLLGSVQTKEISVMYSGRKVLINGYINEQITEWMND